MIRIVACAGLALAAALPGQRAHGMFDVVRDGDRVTVSANLVDVTCDRALQALADALGWKLSFALDTVAPRHGEQIASRLAAEYVDVAVVGKDPRDVASLIAVAGGAELLFRDLPPPGSGAIEMVVTECPDPATAAGADRLRERALFWYRRFLAESPRANDPTDDDNIVTRMRVADVLRARDGEDDVSEALLVLKDSIEMAPGSLRAPSILVRMVECYRELGPGWEREAERNARRIVERYADSEQAAAGVILLGRILYEQGEYAACIHELDNRRGEFARRPEATDLSLLVAAAHHALGRPQECLDELAGLRAVGPSLSDAQRADVEYLTGSALVEIGEFEHAERPLERFVTRVSRDDPRFPLAWLQLGRAWYAEQRFLHARLAALVARRAEKRLDRDDAAAVRELWSRALLATDPHDDAVLGLEVELQRHPEAHGELAVVLGEELIRRGYHGKAARTLERFAARDDELGDRCRVLQIRAMFAEGRASGTLPQFLERARPIAERIRSEASQAVACELFAEAFEASGDVLRAASARQGVIR